MTRKSKREIERVVEDLDEEPDRDGPETVVVRDTVVGTESEVSDLARGERVVTEEEYEL